MSHKISKELFEAVMGFKIKSITIGNFIFWEMEDEYKPDYGISINDFFFMCKEWALQNNFKIQSGAYTVNTGKIPEIGGYDATIYHIFKFGSKCFNANSEQQAVFDACQWILDKKDKKK